jgi:predicted AlkP superfamily phosphohydrolase/phosphomutase
LPEIDRRMPHAAQLALIGLDGLDPAWLATRFPDALPNLRAFCDAALHGPLHSCLPPTAIPAWSCIGTGKDPGTLGVYGPRIRRDWSYEELAAASNLEVRQPRLWDHLRRSDRASLLVGVPQTFPMIRAIRGCQVTGPLTPDTDALFTHPPELADEIAERVGDYIIDVPQPAVGESVAAFCEEVGLMTEQRLAIAGHLVSTRPWQLLWVVDNGPQRMLRALWRTADLDADTDRDDPARRALRDYLQRLDAALGKLLEALHPTHTAIWLLSAHGVQARRGTFHINAWLEQQGLLRMKPGATGPGPFALAAVDWSATQVWAAGGAAAQLYVNCAEREPQGIVATDAYEPLCAALIERLEALTDHVGAPMGNRVLRPRQAYDAVNGTPPDLILLAGDLAWRCSERVGEPDVYEVPADATGDDAGPTLTGWHALRCPGIPAGERPATLLDVLPTVMGMMGLPRPSGLTGEALIEPDQP